MSELEIPMLARVGLPDPSTVVSQTEVRPLVRSAQDATGAPRRSATIYRILRTTQVDSYDAEAQFSEIELLERMRERRAAGEEFRGTARKAAKIAISPAETEQFADLVALIDSLPTKREMVEHEPRIGTGATSDRVAKEHRNVRLRAFIYAASREDDNDYHLIVGRHPDKAPMYMNVELSGTPPPSSEHFPRLRAARDAFKEFFPEPGDLPGLSYDFYDPPIPVEIEGSLYFDMSHASGTPPGPQDLRCNIPVIWEIHPISEIVMEP